MEHRLGRTLRVFLVILAAAGFYRLTVMPLVEPRHDLAATALELTPEEAAAIQVRRDRRLAALGDIFPEGAWERNEPIKLEGRQMLLLFKEYQTLPDGRVNLVPCTLVVLSDRSRVADGPAGRKLVMRAPQGAVLEFDEPLDLKQGRLPRFVGGSLRGQVTIRGTPSAPGAEDDIEIVTRDVALDELEVRTGEMVQFRYGRSSGSGRGLVATLKPGAEQRGGGDPLGQSPNVGGVDSIRLERDVRMRLEGLAGGFLPGDEARAAAPPDADQAGQQVAAPPPVLVSCRGSLCFNVSANVITLEDHVEVVRTAADGDTDQLSCELLAILLAAEKQGDDESDEGGLEPREIQAQGTPVVARSTAAGLEARGARLGYELATRRILLDGPEPVSLVARGTQMEARKIDYLPGPPGDVGALMAVGPGWLQVRSENSPPAQARWQQWLRMRPDGTGHVVSIAGDADVAIETRGRLAAAEMHLWLEVVKDAAGPARGSTGGPDLSGVKPARMLARGMVEADTDQVSARTDRLELWFREEAGQPIQQPAGVSSATQTPAPVPAPGGPPPTAAPRRGRLTATAALVRGLVTLSPQGNDLAEMSMEGQVNVREESLPGATKPGIEIAGEQVQLSRPTRFDARAVVSGRPAIVRGQGLDLSGPLVEFDRGRNRVVVDGAGKLVLPIPAGGGLDALALTGPTPRPAAPPAPGTDPGKLDVAWRGRLDFDGRTARFSDEVVAATPETTVRAGVIDVVFDEAFDFGGDRRPPGGGQPEVARVSCGGGVKLESEMTDDAGEKSRQRLFVRDLVVERASGNVSGTGPGRLTSTRAGGAPALNLPAAPGGAPPVRPVAAAGRAERLQYLGVDFQRGLTGNIHRRMMEFHQRVEAIAGPVAGWDDTLDPHGAGGLPEGVVAITCDVLGVGQAPPLPGLARNTLELAAGGNVLVEGESFTARSARLTWSEAKDLLVFEGDGRAYAQLFRQLRAGGQPSEASAGKILYWRGLNRVDVEDVGFFDLDQLGKGPLPQLPGSPPARGQPQAPFAPRPVPGT
jgi:hypothetical protein